MKEFLDRIANLSPKRLALLAAQLNEKVQALEPAAAAGNAVSAPLAIVGMACRMPGGAGDPETFWQALRDGRDLIGEIPSDRWNAGEWYDPDPETPGKMATRWGAFLDGIDLFDRRFFGIAPKEAASMDPQQRLLLETAWQALEDAGHAGRRPRGRQHRRLHRHLQLRLRAGASLLRTRSHRRLSRLRHVPLHRRRTHFVPARACMVPASRSTPPVLRRWWRSTSPVKRLRLGECGMALAGGVNVILRPDLTVALRQDRA